MHTCCLDMKTLVIMLGVGICLGIPTSYRLLPSKYLIIGPIPAAMFAIISDCFQQFVPDKISLFVDCVLIPI